ncbi:uncharacterized protein LOC108989976 [Juglans regia]|uniref:Uncharacterized protein LOC108989976 n=1 Tax=Juglans regia TaxID=51240 RepID=A0A6P9F5T6_JUGRE|nr:uncharacterized protein LOC108989976 [Juglans regia]
MYKDLIRCCPQHGLPNWLQVQMFYNGLNGQTRTIVDVAASGTLMSKTVEEYVAATSMTIPSNEESQEQVQYINNWNYNYCGNPMPNYYYPGLQNHENLSYRNTKNVLQPQPPPGFDSQSSEKKISLEDAMVSFVQETNVRFKKTDSRLDNIETHCSNMGATIKNLEVQIGQLAKTINSQQRGTFPSNIEMNPNEQYKAITLRSGREIERSPSKETNSTLQLKIMAKAKIKLKKRTIHQERLTNALEQMPNYVKFLKDTISKKRRLKEFGTMKLSEECSTILQKKLPQKLKDPGSFTLPCTIGNSFFDKVLCDLGTSINLMPLSVCRKLGLGELKQTTISLQLANQSIKYPHRIIEDVLVKVDKFIFPADFVVLDMEEDQEVPLILGYGMALIDVQNGELTLRVNKEEVVFNIYQAMRFLEDPSICFLVDVIKKCVEEAFEEDVPTDHLERCITTSSHTYDFNNSTIYEYDLPFVSEEFLHYVFALGALQQVRAARL